METEIIVVKQLPVIVEQLAQVREQVSERVKIATALVCTEENVRTVKKARAELNAEFKTWESKRKEVKTAVMTPYEQFEAVYKDCVSDAYKTADVELKRKIDSVENELKQNKTAEIRNYFYEYLEAAGIDFVDFESAGINVTLSASLKSLREQAKTFIDKIRGDLLFIDTQEHKAEILVEYKKSLDVASSIMGVNARFKAIEDEKRRIEEAEERKAAEEQHIAEIDHALPAPQPEPQQEEKLYTLRFAVTASKKALKELKNFLDNGGYKYE